MLDYSLVEHEVFTKWAEGQGVQIRKIVTARFPGRGLGIIATDNIEVGEVLAVAPASVLITASSASAEVRRKLGRITVHGLLAAMLALDAQGPDPSWQEWRVVWPSREDFNNTIPLLWESHWQELLPPGAKEILRGQIRKTDKDFKIVSKAFPGISRRDYLYHWLVVNTRSFYYIIPGMKKSPSSDCMALCPFVDYFNHAETGCEVTSGRDGFRVISDRVYARGEEIYISYGNHPNDVLLTEYGFGLNKNKWDEVRLDHLIIPRLSHEQRDRLRDAGYLGKYILDHESICYRTQVALRLLSGPLDAWRQSLTEGEDNENDKERINGYLMDILRRFHEEAVLAIKTLADMNTRTPPYEMLKRRWMQISQTLSKAMAEIAH